MTEDKPKKIFAHNNNPIIRFQFNTKTTAFFLRLFLNFLPIYHCIILGAIGRIPTHSNYTHAHTHTQTNFETSHHDTFFVFFNGRLFSFLRSSFISFQSTIFFLYATNPVLKIQPQQPTEIFTTKINQLRMGNGAISLHIFNASYLPLQPTHFLNQIQTIIFHTF